MKNKIIAVVLLLVLIAGIAVIALKGVNYELRFSDSKELDLYIEKQISVNDIKPIVKEVMGNQPISVRYVEEYGDSVAIIARDMTDEQKTEIINKINEKFGSEMQADSTELVTLSHVRGIDMVKKFVLPFAISTSIILVYLVIRYFKLGLVKVLLKSIIAIVLGQAELLSVLALTRFPIGRTTTLLVLTVYLVTLVVLTTRFENKLQEIKAEENK